MSVSSVNRTALTKLTYTVCTDLHSVVCPGDLGQVEITNTCTHERDLSSGFVRPGVTNAFLEFTHFSVDISIVLGLDPCVTKANLPAMPPAGKPAGRMEKREEGKTRSSLGFLPLFPTFPFFLSLTLSCPAVSLEFPVEWFSLCLCGGFPLTFGIRSRK
jgi:hypothetical protein